MKNAIAATLFAILSLANTASAERLDRSLRPKARAVADVAAVPVVEPIEQSQRPRLRPMTLAAVHQAQKPVLHAKDPGFQRWVRGFRHIAISAGVSAATFDRAFRGVHYNGDVVIRDRKQTEFTKTIGQYLGIAASDKRIREGREALAKHHSTLERIEAHYGVDKEVVVAVWGLESSYGTRRGDIPVIEALATLAYDGRRGRFFSKQLIAALKILQRGDTTPTRMTGSWAGAMGHTQFIPTSYQAYAVDFTGDGRRDIWSEDPTDALASTAAYLKRFGWRNGMPWGVEVTLPRGFDYSIATRTNKKMPSQWARLGVVGTNGRPVPDHGSASIFLPAGARGAAFLIFKNFDVIKRYNAADAYATGVGHLSDRIAGRGPLKASWPKDERALTFAERKELQRRLTRRGFNTGGVDGRVGPATARALRSFQRSIGEIPDGTPSLHILRRLR